MAKVKPIIIENPETGEKYTLEFNRRTVKMAEDAGITLSSITEDKRLMAGYSGLFYYAFLMHHPQIKAAKAESILFDDMGGMTEAMATRLIELFAEPYNTLVKSDESGDGEAKNAKWSVTL